MKRRLNEDDYEIIIERAYIAMRKANSGVQGQIIVPQNGIDYWVMMETQKYLEEYNLF